MAEIIVCTLAGAAIGGYVGDKNDRGSIRLGGAFGFMGGGTIGFVTGSVVWIARTIVWWARPSAQAG